MNPLSNNSLDRDGPDLPPSCNCRAGDRRVGPQDRVEALIGTDLARLLLNALTSYRPRPDRRRGTSAP